MAERWRKRSGSEVSSSGVSTWDAWLAAAANHASHVDTPLLLTSLPERFRHRSAIAAGADYFFDKRWKGAMWAFLINAFPIERLRLSRRGADLAGRLLDA